MLADRVAELCYSRYSQLPRQGKPRPGREWTLLAAFVVDRGGDDLEVAAMGTGTKCIGALQMSRTGEVLNDSHAEVIARRGFLRYLYHHLKLVHTAAGSPLLEYDTDTRLCSFKPGISIILFASHTPCGDASIVPMTCEKSDEVENTDTTDVSSYPESPVGGMPRKRKLLSDTTQIDSAKKMHHNETDSVSCVEKCEENVGSNMGSADIEQPDKVGSILNVATTTSSDVDIHRTGAKVVSGSDKQDPLSPGARYHAVGVLRRKPGRGQATLSFSCSDKLARWAVVGLQGALISHFLTCPVRIKTLVLGAGCPFCPRALHRALLGRTVHVTSLPEDYGPREICFLQSNLEFEHSQSQIKRMVLESGLHTWPCPAAISWVALPENSLEVSIRGNRQGATKKIAGTTPARDGGCLLHTYYDYKMAAKAYQGAWQNVKEQAFQAWSNATRTFMEFE
uniref:tRNA-specific adenosine deaminase 1-like isoform X2 n=1 Tax=Myxine glutinosa TaxID=7769 RepID=UPI00358F348A